MKLNKPDGWIEIRLHDAICPPDEKHNVQLNTTVHWFRSSKNPEWRKYWSGWRLRSRADNSSSVSEFEGNIDG